MAVFFTSDTHAFHKNITEGVTEWADGGTLRPFPDEVAMTEHMANVINSHVTANDILWHLGDWSFGGEDKIPRFREMLNCNHIKIVLGNHDHHIRRKDKYRKLFDKVYYGPAEKKICGQYIYMSHFAHVVWNHSHHGSWHLFGHSHGTLNKWTSTHMPNAKMLDVGVDNNEFVPWDMDALHAVLDHPRGEVVDHHNENTT